MFTEKETEYLKSQRLARIGTVSADLQPDVSPVGYEFDGEYFYVGGMNNKATRKYKNVADGNSRVALVVDDLESVDPWSPRGIRVFGTADIVDHEGYAGSGSYLRIRPTVTWSWNVEASSFQDGKFRPHKTQW